MNSDIRLSTGFFHHPKTVKLKRRIGSAGLVALLQLWTWAAQNKPDGNLAGMDNEDMAIAAGWEDEPDDLVEALSAARFLDGQQGEYVLHGWQEHQSYAAAEPARIEKARKAAQARWAKRDASSNAPSRPEQCSNLPEQNQAMPQTKPNQTKPSIDLEHTHDGSHDFYQPADSQGVRVPPAPLNGEDIEERKDAVQAQHRRGDYEFRLVRDAYDGVKPEAPQAGYPEFLRLYNSPQWHAGMHEEILAGLDALAKGDRQFLGEERYRPGLAKFLTQGMWKMKPRAPDGQDGVLTPEQEEAKRMVAEGRRKYEEKMAKLKEQRRKYGYE